MFAAATTSASSFFSFAKTTPCTVAGAGQTKGLRRGNLRNPEFHLTRRAKQEHDGIIATIACVHARPIMGALDTWLRVSSSSTSRNLNRRTAGP
jgi:hypothetical protein